MTERETRRRFLVRTGSLLGGSLLAGCGGGGDGGTADAGCPAPDTAFDAALADGGLVVDAATGLVTKKPATAPSPAMARFIAGSRMGLFMHFGMDTFADTELGDGKAPASLYAPPAIDAEGWVATAREGGIDYVLLVCKHHDGFCLWPADNTDYTVANSGNTTDVVRAVSDACRRQGLRFGVYYSLWDRHWDNAHGCGENTAWVYTDEQNAEYFAYMRRHLQDLLSNYGDVALVWFDASWAKAVDRWPLDAVYDVVKRLQPACQVGINGTMLDATSAKVYPSDFRLQDPYLPAFPDSKLVSWGGSTYWLPWQATLPINQHWFWHADDTKLRSLDELESIYYQATGQGNVLVLNSPATTAGVMRADNAARLAELRTRLGLAEGGKAPYPVNLSAAATGSASSVQGSDPAYAAAQALAEDPATRWAADAGDTTAQIAQAFAQPTKVDYVVLREYADAAAATGPYAIRAFTLEAQVGGAWKALASRTTVGVSLLLEFDPVVATALRVRVTQADAPPSLNSFWAFSRPAAGC